MKIIADRDIPFAAECFSSIGEVEIFSGRDITPGVVRQADCLLVRSITRVDSDLLRGSKVRFVATATIGVEHIDVDYLKQNNIGFASAPGSNANSVAEYVVAALLELGQMRKCKLEDKSIGVIGVGNVGSRVAEKAAALGMKVFLNDPPLQRQSGDPKYLPIEDLFDCDFVTIHTPLTFEGIDRTFHLADERFFNSLKSGCVFLNTSRGGVADSIALKEARKSGILEAIVLDVWEGEPDIDAELLEMVDIATPHIAGYSLDGKVSGMIMIYKEACKFFGLEAMYGVDSFLPAPVVKELKIGRQVGSDEDMLREAVKKIYDIKEDDARMRKILNMPTKRKAVFFDQMRTDYPVRREFQNTRLVFKDSDSSLARKLRGIGFFLSQG